MKDTGGIIRICIASAFCAIMIFYSGYRSFFEVHTSLTAIPSTLVPSEKSQYTVIQAINIISDKAPKEDNSNTAPTQSSEVLAAGSSDVVKGKIIEKFISPYTAKSSYNNVYLKNSTDQEVDIKSLLNAKLGFKVQKNDEPQVLILHTHATESYMTSGTDYYTDSYTSRSQDNANNMVALGKIVAEELDAAGIKTIHDTTLHDYPSYNESYSRAAKTITSYTSKYDSIKIVIDLHRDAIAANDTDKVKLTANIDGKKAAQVMLVMGSQSGSVTNFPDWKENLKLALKLQQTLEVMYPSLARSLSLMPKNYNESLTTGSMLIEIGTDGNTLEEAKYSAELLSNSLVALFNTLG